MNVIVPRFARAFSSIVASLLLVLAIDVAPVQASASITPVVLEIDARGRGALRVTNKRDRSVTYQLTPLNWDVVDGKDLYQPSNDFIASPPSFTLKPRQTREIRVGFRNPAQAAVERAYRLVVEEVPFETASADQGLNINLRMRYVLPVYIAPAAAPTADIVWSVRRQGGSAIVKAENRGNRRFVVRELGFNADAASAGAPTHALAEPQSVLAQSWREWTIVVPGGVALETLLVRSGGNSDFAPVPFSQ